MWCQPRTGRPASWNISTVGTRLFPTGRMYRAESVAPSSETKVTVWYSAVGVETGQGTTGASSKNVSSMSSNA